MPGLGNRREAAVASVRHWRPRTARRLLCTLCWGLCTAWGCGSPNPRVLADDEVELLQPERHHAHRSEADKIRRMIEEVRSSDATFLIGTEQLDGPAAADHLEHRVARMGVGTLRQFIDALTPVIRDEGPAPRVRLADGTVLDAHDWYLARVQAIEGVAQTDAGSEPKSDPSVPTKIGILDALTIVERSNKRFVAPARTLPNGKTKGKRKEYDAADFASMLRKKWEFLGADVRDLETFIGEIASDAFSSMEPYRVIHEDGSEEEFRGWLNAQLDLRRAAAAKGGAP